METSCHTKRKP